MKRTTLILIALFICLQVASATAQENRRLIIDINMSHEEALSLVAELNARQNEICPEESSQDVHLCLSAQMSVSRVNQALQEYAERRVTLEAALARVYAFGMSANILQYEAAYALARLHTRESGPFEVSTVQVYEGEGSDREYHHEIRSFYLNDLLILREYGRQEGEDWTLFRRSHTLYQGDGQETGGAEDDNGDSVIDRTWSAQAFMPTHCETILRSMGPPLDPTRPGTSH